MLTPHQQAALNIDAHISLTANAGSGKTFVLSKRYIEIALRKNIPLRSIAAITFTDKAAGELYKKIAGEIESKISEAADAGIKWKLEKLRRQLISANISTIHSFCINILKEFPVEAGIDANFIPIDEQTSDEIIELSIEEVISARLNNNNDDLKKLIRIFGSKGALSKEIYPLIKNRKNVIACESRIYANGTDCAAEYFDKAYKELLGGILNGFESELINSISKINASASGEGALRVTELISQYSSSMDAAARLMLLKDLVLTVCTKDFTIRKKYLKDEYGRFTEEINYIQETAKVLEEFDSVPDAAGLNRSLAEFGVRILNLFNEINTLYQRRKNEHGFLDFEDILLLTQRIIENEGVREYLSGQFKYIMIDEYQDTNELQYNIFLPILDGLKKNNLFVVGDEKQSIYMFRDAELEVFDRTKNDIKTAAGPANLLTLPDSFRMAPEIALFTNYIFRNLFNNSTSFYNEVTHSDLVCARQEDSKGSVEFLLVQDEETDEENNLKEAEICAKKILNIISLGASWSDAAVLCRKRSAFAELEKVFVKNNIPFSILGGKGFYQRQSMYDIYNYFSFLLDDKNDTALVGILRSPFFAYTDAEIYRLSLAEGKNYFQKIKSLTPGNERLKSTYELLRENAALAKNSDIHFVLRKILRESGYMAVLESTANGAQETANIEKLIRLTLKFSSAGYKTLYDYVNYLKEAIERQHDESQAPLSEESNSVKIMTVHQSKGLEFPYVFIYKCSDISQRNSIKSKQITIDKNLGLLTKLPLDNNYFEEYKAAPIISVSKYILKKKQTAELKRLLYVAVTRAKDHLIISADIKKKISGESFIGLIQKGAGVNFEEEKLVIKDKLVFLDVDEGFKNRTEEIELEIPLTKEIELTGQASAECPGEAQAYRYYLEPVEDGQSEEIISATKVAVYSQCAVKYQLTYEFGFRNIFSEYKSFYGGKKLPVNYDFNEIEDDDDNSTIPDSAALKGRIIHKILQENIPAEESEKIREIILHETNRAQLEETAREFYLAEIKQSIKNYYSSETYKEIAEFPVFHNEYEIYFKENDYYLYGIIDKLIIDKEKIIIIDYKTDDIPEEDIENRAAGYLNQLKFYSYIVCRLFKNFSEIRVRLVFIKHPGVKVEFKILPDEINGMGEYIKMMTRAVRQGKFEKNLAHCAKCIYTLNKKSCIKED